MNREAQVQQRVRAIYEAAGAAVYNLSQGFRPGGKRHGTTRQSKGLGDLWVFLPRRRLAWWHETKAPDRWKQLDLTAADRERLYRKKQTAEQRAFEGYCLLCGVRYILGGAAEAETFLAELGLIARPVEPDERAHAAKVSEAVNRRSTVESPDREC